MNMRLVNNLTLVLLFLSFQGISQQNPDNLKKEQRKLEKKISQTKSLLKKVQANSNTSLNEVRLLDNKINKNNSEKK